MDRNECLKIVAEARENGERPNLGGVDLRGVDLQGTDLRGAYLRGADLIDADLTGADLSGTDLYGVYLIGTKGIGCIGPIGSRHHGDMLYYVLHDTCVMVKTDYFWTTLDEFVTYVADTHGDNQYAQAYNAAIEFIRVWERLQREVKDE